MLKWISLYILLMFSLASKAQIKTLELKQFSYCQSLKFNNGKIYLTGVTYQSSNNCFSKIFCVDTALNKSWEATLEDSTSNTVNGLNFHEGKTIVTYLAGVTKPGDGRITGQLSYMLAVVDENGQIEAKKLLVPNVGWSLDENTSVISGDELYILCRKQNNADESVGEFGRYNLTTEKLQMSNLELNLYMPDVFFVKDSSLYSFGKRGQEPKFRQVNSMFKLVKDKSPSSKILKHWFFSKKEQKFFVFVGGVGEIETKQGSTTLLTIDLNGNLLSTKTFAFDTLEKTDLMHKYAGERYWNDEDDCYIVVNNASGDRRLMKINVSTGETKQKPLTYFIEHPEYHFYNFLIKDGFLYAHIHKSDCAISKISWLTKIPFNFN